jgi:ABC-2 type transport system permease protein
MKKLRQVIRHEFRLAAANKTFIVLTLLGPFIILAVTVLPTLLARTPGAASDDRPVAILGAPPALQASLEGAFTGMGITLSGDEGLDVEGAKKAVLGGTLQGALAVGEGWPDSAESSVWYSRTGSDAAMFGALQAMLAAAAREARIVESGLDPAVVSHVLESPPFDVVKLEAGGKEKKTGEKEFMQLLFTVLSFVMLLYMTVMLYGQIIGRSVVTEKTSKTVEIMLSSVTPQDLLFGKILGLGLAGLLQYSVWVSMALVLTRLVGPVFGLSLPPAITAGNLVWLVVFFVLAFFLYSAAFAALGAASEDEQHLGQMAWPLLAFLIVPFVMVSSFISNPDSAVALVLSLFPMTSPIVMFVRVLVSSPPVWELALCLGVLVASVFGMALLAARVFRVGILLTGKRAKLGEILRWIWVK